jgi:hypothetical protein
MVGVQEQCHVSSADRGPGGGSDLSAHLLVVLGPHRDHHPDHPNHHRDAEQRAEDGQDRKPEDDRRDDEQAGSHAAQQVRSVLPEVVPDGSHRSLLSSLRTLRAQAPIAIRSKPSSAGLHY